jgi:hypothetical protein
MTFAVRVREEVKAKIPAVVHVDGTSRIQTVHRGDNPRFHRLLVEFDRLTGIPLVVNTSFNRKGEPIVETPDDALRAFLNMELDALVLERYWVTRRNIGAFSDGECPLLNCRMTAERAFDVVEHRYPGGKRHRSVQLPPGLEEQSERVGASREGADLLAYVDEDISVGRALRKCGIETGRPAASEALDTLLKLHKLGWIRLEPQDAISLESRR